MEGQTPEEKTQELVEFLESWDVDEVVECLDLSDEVETELLDLAPTAYDAGGVRLTAVWDRLTATAKGEILAAADEEGQLTLHDD